MNIDDRLSGFVAVLFGSLVIYWANDLPTLKHIEYGPGFFPTLIGAGFILSGVFLIIQRSLLLRRNGRHPPLFALGEWRHSPRHVGGLALTLGALLFYIYVAQEIGFLLTMAIILTVLIGWWHQRWLSATVIAVCVTCAIQIFFQQFLSVPLPWGLLESYAGLFTWK